MLKNLVRKVLLFFHLDLTKNLEYDRLTLVVLNRVLKKDSAAIDIGCHKGEILKEILRFAPQGKHVAFEPIPEYLEYLKTEFAEKADIMPFALANETGTRKFQFVLNAPAFSGLKKRDYLIKHPEIREIEVQVRKLDDVLAAIEKIDLVKIDVEGGEFDVLKGGKEIFKKHRPVIVFEYGLGAGNHYGTDPEDLYNFISTELGLKIGTMKSYVKMGKPLTVDEFKLSYRSNSDYYYVAYPQERN